MPKTDILSAFCPTSWVMESPASCFCLHFAADASKKQKQTGGKTQSRVELSRVKRVILPTWLSFLFAAAFRIYFFHLFFGSPHIFALKLRYGCATQLSCSSSWLSRFPAFPLSHFPAFPLWAVLISLWMRNLFALNLDVHVGGRSILYVVGSISHSPDFYFGSGWVRLPPPTGWLAGQRINFSPGALWHCMSFASSAM